MRNASAQQAQATPLGMSFLPMTKQNARLIVSQVVLDALEGLKMAYPKTSAKRRQELQAIRKQLA